MIVDNCPPVTIITFKFAGAVENIQILSRGPAHADSSQSTRLCEGNAGAWCACLTLQNSMTDSWQDTMTRGRYWQHKDRELDDENTCIGTGVVDRTFFTVTLGRVLADSYGRPTRVDGTTLLLSAEAEKSLRYAK